MIPEDDDAIRGGRARVGLDLTREQRQERARRNSPFAEGAAPAGVPALAEAWPIPPHRGLEDPPKGPADVDDSLSRGDSQG